MSKENLRSFINKVTLDTSLQEKLSEENSDPISIAKECGFDFTDEDIKSVQEIFGQESELSEKELETVAGGAIRPGADECDPTEQKTCFETHGPCGCPPPSGVSIQTRGGGNRSRNYRFWMK